MDLKVDELIASIRKSVDSDMETLTGETRGTLLRGALREMRVSMEGSTPDQPVLGQSQPRQQEISTLRERIRRNIDQHELLAAAQPAPPPPSSYAQTRPEQTPAVQPQPPLRHDFSRIMTLPSQGQDDFHPQIRPSYADQVADDLTYPQAQWRDPPHAPTGHRVPVAPGKPLLSPQAEAATEYAFRQLSDTLLSRAFGERGMEDVAREMLRGMIKQWLDANLPGLVEALVRQEIERVARRGH